MKKSLSPITTENQIKKLISLFNSFLLQENNDSFLEYLDTKGFVTTKRKNNEMTFTFMNSFESYKPEKSTRISKDDNKNLSTEQKTKNYTALIMLFQSLVPERSQGKLQGVYKEIIKRAFENKFTLNLSEAQATKVIKVLNTKSFEAENEQKKLQYILKKSLKTGLITAGVVAGVSIIMFSAPITMGTLGFWTSSTLANISVLTTLGGLVGFGGTYAKYKIEPLTRHKVLRKKFALKTHDMSYEELKSMTNEILNLHETKIDYVANQNTDKDSKKELRKLRDLERELVHIKKDLLKNQPQNYEDKVCLIDKTIKTIMTDNLALYFTKEGKLLDVDAFSKGTLTRHQSWNIKRVRDFSATHYINPILLGMLTGKDYAYNDDEKVLVKTGDIFKVEDVYLSNIKISRTTTVKNTTTRNKFQTSTINGYKIDTRINDDNSVSLKIAKYGKKCLYVTDQNTVLEILNLISTGKEIDQIVEMYQDKNETKTKQNSSSVTETTLTEENIVEIQRQETQVIKENEVAKTTEDPVIEEIQGTTEEQTSSADYENESDEELGI